MKKFLWTKRSVSVAVCCAIVIISVIYHLPMVYEPLKGSKMITISIRGVARNYILHVPKGYDGSRAVPFVLVLHGRTGNGLGMEELTGWDKIADQHDVIVAYPNALGHETAWNVGYLVLPDAGDDIAFLRTLIVTVQSKYHIDPNRIFATGFSSGAIMTYRLGAQMPGTFAAIAPVSGAIGPANKKAFAPYVPAKPISVIAFHGMQDQIIPYSDGPALSAPEAVELWANADACKTVSSGVSPGDPNVRIVDYKNGNRNTEVKLYSIVDGGHQYPPNATYLIWQFFSEHPRQ